MLRTTTGPSPRYRAATEYDRAQDVTTNTVWMVVPIENADWTAPALAVDPIGTVHIITLSTDATRLRYRTWQGGVLSDPTDSEAVSPGIGGHCAEWCPEGMVKVSFTKSPAFGTWGDLMLGTVSASGWQFETVVPGSFGYCTSIACDPEGYVHITYKEEPDGNLRYWTNRPGLEPAVGYVEVGCNPGRYSSLRVDSNRRPHIAYSRWSTPCVAMRYAYWNGTGWQVDQPCGSTNTFRYVAMVLDSADRPHISFHDSDANATHYARDSETGWCCDVVATPESRYTNIELDSSGTPWIRAVGSFLFHRLGGSCPYTWEQADLGLPADAWLDSPRRYFRIDANDNMYVAFRDTQGVKLAVNLPDCNSNGIPDDEDIAGGTSADCNTNAIPDECDIADGTSLDVNGNGVPDECDIPCAPLAARSCKEHAGSRFCLDTDDGNDPEPRLEGITDVEIDLDTAAGFLGGVSMDCTTAWSGSVNTVVDQNTVTLAFDPALPDEAACTVTLDCGAAVCVRGLAGDADLDGVVTVVDNAATKLRFGMTVDATNARFDFNRDGDISPVDNSQRKLRFGNYAPACP